jgi:hypothetical protein
MYQILQILPKKLEAQPKAWSCAIKAGLTDSLASVCLDLKVQYTLKGKDGTSIEFMCDFFMVDQVKKHNFKYKHLLVSIIT